MIPFFRRFSNKRILSCSFVRFTKTVGEDMGNMSRQLGLPLTPVPIRRSSKKHPLDSAGLDLARKVLDSKRQLYAILEKYKLVQEQ